MSYSFRLLLKRVIPEVSDPALLSKKTELITLKLERMRNRVPADKALFDLKWQFSMSEALILRFMLL